MQTVALPVEMEEDVLIHLFISTIIIFDGLAVSALVGTQDRTAREAVSVHL